MKLSVIIPVYNEENTVAELLKRVNKAKLPKNVSKEVVVVNDASGDNSVIEIVKAKKKYRINGLKLISHKVNKGKGAAVNTGIKKAKGDVLIIQDADLEYNPNDYQKLINPIVDEKAKVVYGSRLKDFPLKIRGVTRTPLITHYLGNKLLTFITNLLYESSITDMETCYKVFSKDVVKGIKIRAKRFDLEPELTAKVLKRGYKIHEVAIKVKPRGYDEGKKISWKDGFIAVWTLIKYKFID